MKNWFLFATALLGIALRVGSTPRLSAHLQRYAAVPRYELSVQITPDAHRLAVTGTAQLSPAAQVRNALRLVLSEQMHRFQVEVLEPQTSAGAAKLQGSRPEGGSVTWTLTPIRPIPAGERIRLKFSYVGGEKIASVFYVGPEGTFAGGNSTAWFPQVERDARGTGRLKFNVPGGYTVVAPGKQTNTAAQAARGEFGFSVDRPSWFSFAAARYQIVRHSGGKIPITAYLLRLRPNIRTFLKGCANVLDVLSREFGPLPYGAFALVEVPTEQAGQAQFEGASCEGFILSNGAFLDKEFNTAYYGHEIAHQWWGVAVGRKWWEGRRGRLMLDEAMAQYGSLRAVEEVEGARAAERYRSTGYPGYIDFHSASGYFMVAAGGYDSSLANLPSGDPVPRILADSKGFLVYDMLSRSLGRAKFRQILRSIARKYAFGNVSWNGFLREIEAESGQGLKWFYDQWLGRTGAPEWKIAWTQTADKLRVTIRQTAPFYRCQLEIRAEGDAQSRTKTVALRAKETHLTFPVGFRVRSVAVDPNFKVLHWTPEYVALRPALGAYLRANMEREQGNVAGAEALLKAALARQTEPDRYGARFLLETGLGQLYLSQNRFQDARSHLEAAVACPARRTSVLPWTYYYLARAAQGLGDKEAARRAINAAATAETVSGGQIGAASAARSLLIPE